MFKEHGASKAGKKAENKVKNALKDAGFSLLQTKSEFIAHYSEKDSSLLLWKKYRKITMPDKYVQFYGATSTFQSDGFIPEIEMMIEIKNSTSSGTTEQKVWNDFRKMKDGVYSGAKLIYLFMGPKANLTPIYKHFAYEVKEEIDPTEEKVKVLFDDTPDLSILKAYLTSEYDLWRQRNGG